MVLNIWDQPSGTSLGIFPEQIYIEKLLLPVRTRNGLITPITQDYVDVKFSVIAGSLPAGLYIENNYITGVPLEVPVETTYEFCVRAQDSNLNVSDRTFTITIDGADSPEFLTPSGRLNLYGDNRYYALDQTYVEFQIRAYDFDSTTGQELTYWISSTGGILPPGLKLSTTGVISGFIEPIPAIVYAINDGTYDNGLYDSEPFDFAAAPTTGYDTFGYDWYGYDFSYPEMPVKKLNRNYPFDVSVSDGTTVVQRRFSIIVIADSYFRADNSAMRISDTPYTTDASFVRSPVWKTPAELGSYKSDNYLIIPLEVYDKHLTFFNIEDVTALPPGLNFDFKTGSLYGQVPYQTIRVKTYQFTVIASRRDIKDQSNVVHSPRTFTLTLLGELASVITWDTASDLGTIGVEFISTLQVKALSTLSNTEIIYKLSNGALPQGLQLLVTGEIVGKPNWDNITVFDFFYEQTLWDNGITMFGDVLQFDPPKATTFDNEQAVFDRIYQFEIVASDRFAANPVTRTFKLRIVVPEYIKCSNITAQPMLITEQRNKWEQFISDQTIFAPSLMYRLGDPNFGVGINLSMLIYGGIETTKTEFYEAAIQNYYSKRLVFDSLQVAVAIDPVSKQTLYEVVYMLMSEYDTNSANTISQWQRSIKRVGYTERNFLPLWMRTIQPNSRIELGYKLAVPLCYCKVNESSVILNNIHNSNFDFSKLDYYIDRLIISSTLEFPAAKYLILR